MEVKYLEGVFDVNDYKELVILDFFADWCPPCKRMTKEIDSLTMDYPVTILKVDTDEYRSLAAEMNIKSLPTLVFLNKGSEQSNYIGFKTKDQIEMDQSSAIEFMRKAGDAIEANIDDELINFDDYDMYD